ncbi:hypothetical protein E3N88_40846 [Mikania micrantha]|uniref:Uncharacterized protein n=1 Tax=Mikania micrantha TaxID=192012 RepID=A0A5N6LNV5_9ASTR|nr:hypothetical protein E3N88_40846 [Mikania micrantha]
MKYSSTEAYLDLLDELSGDPNVSDHTVSLLMGYVRSIYRSDLQNSYSEPMLWIGMYIALASLCCIFAMVADLFHGLRSRKLWFPCKYFTIDAVSLTVISVAMKLPVDLSGSMPGDVDQAAKLGSMAFMCTMMANFLPCLATMNNNELLTNIIALCVLVVTLVVNVCIQMQTGVVSYKEAAHVVQAVAKSYKLESMGVNKHRNTIIAAVYVTLLLLLLLIHVCSSLAILKSKQIIESKYQQGHAAASKEVTQSTGRLLSVEKLHKHVSNYWIMAGSGNPQFIITCSATTTASGVICALTTILHTLTMSWTISAMLGKDYDSDYKWSTLVILIVQFFGVTLGTIAPISRCFATLSFKVSIKSISNHNKVFKVETYWTQKLYDWKHGNIRYPSRSRKLIKQVINTSKNLLFNICIELQMGVVVVCKMIALIPFFVMKCVLYCLHCWKWLLYTVLSSSGERIENIEQRQYVLQLENEMELAQRTLEGLLKSMNRLIRKGVKKQPNNLLNLIQEKCTSSFQGVKKFDNGCYIPSLLVKVEYKDCWSLPVVTLTTIAITLPNVEKAEVKKLVKSVREGLEYVTLVEENLNASDDYVIVRKGAETLWQEVDVCDKWLGEKLQDIASQVNTTSCQMDRTRQIVQMLLEKAKIKLKEGAKSMDIGGTNDDSKLMSACAYSMCRITRTILDEKESQKELFIELSSRIADIMAACLTNLPQVIAMKCHTSAIEKREACVQAAAQLLGETTEIINTVQGRYSLDMNLDDLPFIDKWRDYYAP